MKLTKFLCFDDKRFVLDDGVYTLAYFHKDCNKKNVMKIQTKVKIKINIKIMKIKMRMRMRMRIKMSMTHSIHICYA